MVLLNKFLFCVKLESAGYIVSIIGVILNVLWLLLCFFLVALVHFFSCAEIRKVLEFFKEADPMSASIPETECQSLRLTLTGILLLISLIPVAFAVMGFKSIQGILNRDHAGVKPLMIYFLVAGLLSFGFIYFNTFTAIVSAVSHGVFDLYFFLTFYSLYVQLRDEKKQGSKAQQERQQTLKASQNV